MSIDEIRYVNLTKEKMDSLNKLEEALEQCEKTGCKKEDIEDTVIVKVKKLFFS